MTSASTHYAGGLGADTYDLLLNGAMVEGDIAFYLDCARESGGPVLELATGTGRVLVPLAEHGHEVTGLDLSPAMLAKAQAKFSARGLGPPQARLVQGDMTSFDLAQRFALVLVPFRSFQHVTEPAAQRAALRCIHRHMKAGGHLILNLFDPRFDLLVDPAASAGRTREAHDPASGHLMRCTLIARDVDFTRQVVTERMRLEVVDASGAVLASEETRWSLRWTLRQEMAYLLELTGFEPVAEYSDFRKSPPAYGREQIWVARRAI